MAMRSAPPWRRRCRRPGSCEHELRAGGVLVTDADYGEFVTLHLAVPVGERAAVTEEVARLTGGGAEFVLGETEWVDRT